MAGKKLQKTNNTAPVAAPVVEAVPVVAAAPVVEVTPVVAAAPGVTQKGGRKKKVEAVVETVATPAVTEVVATTPLKGGKKAKAVATTSSVTVAASTTEETKPKAAQKGGRKKKELTPVVSVAVTDVDVDSATDRHVRSFKVKLPNKEDFEGRFTGLTPYQAANKALSKYFRETETPSAEITFSICESTRKSKKTVYTYVGKRQKLEVPVTYKIQDGREIVKNFKNSLKKVKKSDTAASAASTSA